MANAKAKKMESEVVVAETKEVGFSDLELTIKKPSLGKDGTMVVGGNFEELAGQIAQVVEKYKGTVLTEDNVNYVKALKTQFQKLRTGIEMKRKDWKKVYITTPSKLLDAMCDDLQKIVAEGESSLGSQLEAYDQKRKDELTEVLKGYVEEAVKAHSLRDEYATRITLKDKYYNVTQKEEDSADDIEAQAVELEKEMKAYDAGVELIKAECEGTLLVVDNYISQLKYKSAMEIVLQIKTDKKKAQELYEQVKQKEAEGEKVSVGKLVTEELQKAISLDSKDEAEETRTRVLRVTYKPSQAKLMAVFFRENKIRFEFINTDF